MLLFLFLLNNKQVAVGELELNSEFSLMQWSVEDFENKIQVWSAPARWVIQCYYRPA
jgi:hypothetical protein